MNEETKQETAVVPLAEVPADFRLPGYPTLQELELMKTYVREIAHSGLLPNHLKGSPYAVLQVVLKGHELGLTAQQSIEGIYVVRGRTAITVGIMAAKVREAGGRWKIIEHDNEVCQIEFERDDVKQVFGFTIEEARNAGLIKKDSAWENYSIDMLWNRAFARGARKVWPDVLLGLYLADEIPEEAKQAEVIDAEPVDDVPYDDGPRFEPSAPETVLAEFASMGVTREMLAAKFGAVTVDEFADEDWVMARKLLKDVKAGKSNWPPPDYKERIEKERIQVLIGACDTEDDLLALWRHEASNAQALPEKYFNQLVDLVQKRQLEVRKDEAPTTSVVEVEAHHE